MACYIPPARLYLDFERHGEKIIEIGAVLTFDQCVVDTFHKLIKLNVDDPRWYTYHARFSHCIHCDDLSTHGIDEYDAKQAFFEWLKTYDDLHITLVGHGVDTTESALKAWMPQLEQLTTITYQQVTLHPWAERQDKDYHKAAYTMKLTSQKQLCSQYNHALDLHFISKDCNHNHSKIARYVYGFHCALFDSYELAFYENSLPLFCCDAHFSNYMNV